MAVEGGRMQLTGMGKINKKDGYSFMASRQPASLVGAPSLSESG